MRRGWAGLHRPPVALTDGGPAVDLPVEIFVLHLLVPGGSLADQLGQDRNAIDAGGRPWPR